MKLCARKHVAFFKLDYILFSPSSPLLPHRREILYLIKMSVSKAAVYKDLNYDRDKLIVCQCRYRCR